MNITYYPVFILIAFVPFVFIPSTGHDVLIQPFNIFLCEVVVVAIFLSALNVHKGRSWIVPEGWIWLCSFPLAILVANTISGFDFPRDLAIRLITICAALLLFFSFFQFQPTRRSIDTAIYILLVGMLLNMIQALLQAVPGRLLYGMISHPPVPRPLGFFMQPNLLASSVVTGMVLAIYQLSSPGFKSRSKVIKALTYAVVIFGAYTVLSTGSRLGLLALVVAIPIVFICRYKLLSREKYRPLTVAALVAIGVFAGAYFSDGLDKSYSKLERLVESSSDMRPHMYRIAADLFFENPVAGQGVGSFPGAFQYEAADYVASHPEADIRFRTGFTHPHNEILMWAVEGGAIALLGLFVLAGAVLWKVYHNGWQRGGAILAMLMPMSLHMMVEMPFYISVYHFIVFVFIVHLAYRPWCRKKIIRNDKVLIAVPMVGCVVFIGGLMFFTSTFKASRQLSQFLYYNSPDINEVAEASENPYFHEFGTAMLMKLVLHQALTGEADSRWVDVFIKHAEPYLKKVPENTTFHDLALAYAAKGNADKAEHVIKTGLYLYPEHPVILKARERVEILLENDGVFPRATDSNALGGSAASLPDPVYQ
ncbi:O-antigen ligase family protein [Marinobacterium stanieri]|uniref:O-antigen ligase n=1 Tax=Marinobacterium stanieri TaxID=49186 RepID=A0A1N6SDA1_9GAMM|nr:O-antigen ligase family protein [Marinobacterium stanieri]SIQ39051.1 O-antigen ligase [Marinobacterium stanieri]